MGADKVAGQKDQLGQQRVMDIIGVGNGIVAVRAGVYRVPSFFSLGFLLSVPQSGVRSSRSGVLHSRKKMRNYHEKHTRVVNIQIARHDQLSVRISCATRRL